MGNWSSMPECCRLYLVEIAYHHPIQLFEGLTLHRRMSTTCRWILSEDQVALDLAVEHGVTGGQVRVIANDLGQPAITDVAIFLIRSFAVPCMQQAANISRKI